MSLSEAARQVQCLAVDPSSHLFAEFNGWKYPVDRTALVVMDLFDAFAKVHFKKPKPLARPWDTKRSEVLGRETSLTQEEVIAALRAAGHNAPLPSAA